jgi:hypothetical protein
VSLRLTSESFAIAEAYSLLIPVLPNQTYEVSYWVKTDLEVQGADLYGKVKVSQHSSEALEADDVNINRLDAGNDLGQSVGGTTGWAFMSYTFTTRSDTAFVRLRATMGGQVGTVRGSFWLDGVTIRQK